MMRALTVLGLLTAVARAESPPPASVPDPGISEGKRCPTGQTWSPYMNVCVGSPGASAPTTPAAPTTCGRGQAITDDTDGHCCWVDQVWSRGRQLCIGVPRCPSGMSVHGEACRTGCPTGQRASDDTDGHCCWPNQAWSKIAARCRGVPACPSGFSVKDEECVAAAAVATGYSGYGGWAAPRPVAAVKLRILDMDPVLPSHVEARDARGLPKLCTTPCTLEVEPGPVELNLEGGHTDFRARVMVPESGATSRIKHASCGDLCTVFGIIGLSAGGLVGLIGLGVAATSHSENCDFNGCTSTTSPGWYAAAGGLAVALIGAVLLANGVGNGVETTGARD